MKPPSLASSSLINSLSKLEQQVVVLAQPRQLEMVARRVKAMNSDLDRLNELKSGRKDASSIAFGLTGAMNAQNANGANAETANKEGSSNDNETKVKNKRQ